jgi:hypothetical protein
MVAPTYFRTLAPNSDNNTIDNITNRVWTNFGSKMLQTSSLSCYIFCSPCSYPFHQTARILAAQLCCTFVPCSRHLSFGVVHVSDVHRTCPVHSTLYWCTVWCTKFYNSNLWCTSGAQITN